jgi:hypothetical protein
VSIRISAANVVATCNFSPLEGCALQFSTSLNFHISFKIQGLLAYPQAARSLLKGSRKFDF